MVGILKRMRRLKELLDIRLGPGAMILSNDVKRIHMSFATRMNEGHMGPRKFWRQYLPRLKYHNPTIPMVVERSTDQAGPAVLSVFFANSTARPAASSKAGKAAASEDSADRVHTIDMKGKHSEKILEEFTAVVEGRQVEATEEDKVELNSLAAQREQSGKDAAMFAEARMKVKREKMILEQARKSIAD